MATPKGFTAKGLAGAQAMLLDIERMVGVKGGAALYFPGGARKANKGQKKAPSYEELIAYLAGEDGKGNVTQPERQRRDIRPNSKEVKEMGEKIMGKVATHLKRVGRTVTDRRTGKQIKLRKKKQSLAGMVAGLRAGMLFSKRKMTARLKSYKDNTGAYKKVTEKYAAQRKRDYGVDESVVFFASGQLNTAMLGAQVKVDLKSK